MPSTLALVEHDVAVSETLAEGLRRRGIEVTVFAHTSDLLAHPGCFEFDFYVLDLLAPGVNAVELVRILRRRTRAGVVTTATQTAADMVASAVTAGADMFLAKPVSSEQISLAVVAVHRRSTSARSPAPVWTLDTRGAKLTAPDGVLIPLSATDVALLTCFVGSAGGTVSRKLIHQRLGKHQLDGPEYLLNAWVFRLRRRIEKSTPIVLPLRAQYKAGYTFQGVLKTI